MPSTTATAIASGVDGGKRRLNGPQTTGREYRNLSTAEFAMRRDNDVPIMLCDGTVLLADVYRPDTDRTLPDSHPMLGFTHTPIGPAATNTIHATSRLLLPIAL